MVEWCWQADSRGLLQGDVCRARAVAKEVSELFRAGLDNARIASLLDYLDDMFDAWASVSHPDVWKSVHGGGGTDGGNEPDLLDESMSGLLAQMMAEEGVRYRPVE